MSRAYAYTILAVIFWTTGPVGSKAALLAARGKAHLAPMQVAFWAVAVGWLALWAVSLARGRLARLRDISPRGWLVLIAMGLFGWVGYPVAINFAYTRLPLPDAMVISYLNPVFVTVFQGSAFGRLVRALSGWEQGPETAPRPPVARIALGLLLCLLGVAVIAAEGHLGRLGRLRSAEGAAAALFAALAWGVYSNLGRFVAVRAGREAKGLGDVQNLAAMAVGLGAMAAGLAAVGGLGPPLGYRTALYLGGRGPAHVDAWAPIVVMALLNYAAGYTLWLYALETGGRAGEAHKLPPLTYLVLVSAIALGWLVLREPFGPAFWEGAALIALGNTVNVWPGAQASARRAGTRAAASQD